MNVLAIKVNLRASWCHSLKEKRMVVNSISQKLKNKFNIAISEVDNQDIHQTIVLGISSVCSDGKQVDSVKENIINFIEDNTEAELFDIEYDTYIF